MFQEGGLWGPGLKGGLAGLGSAELLGADPSVWALGSDSAGSGPGALCLASPGMPSWRGPSQAPCPAELVSNICIEFPVPPPLALAILAIWSAGCGHSCPFLGALG